MEDKNKEVINLKGNDVVSEVRSWYYDRYATILAQRNLLLLLIFILTIGCIIGLLFIKEITLTRTIKPFVIQVEENTGITTVVDSVNNSNFVTRNESIKNYFIVKYLRARETYNNADYEYNYNTIVRLLSSQNVYNYFSKSIRDKENSPISKYGNIATTVLQIRSIQYNDKGDVATVRFKIQEQGAKSGIYNKIATIQFELSTMSVTREESFINPIGFKVTSYRVDDEIFDDNKK
ncbi:MAG: virB8 family protein [Sphingobacteriia bacterium]|nr:virB8 family protein [Sphingobacteriia bacterium]